MGEGECCATRVQSQPLWERQTTGLAVPSPVGRERVRVRVGLFQLRHVFGSYFCTVPKKRTPESDSRLCTLNSPVVTCSEAPWRSPRSPSRNIRARLVETEDGKRTLREGERG